MRVFVASWFFPPATSSEGIVTYKLLRNSQHTYDVCSAESDQWGYSHALPLDAQNIRVLPICTDEIDEWVQFAIETFEREHAAHPYDAVMTRTMPPEAVRVGRAIKNAHPDLPWIASLADPVACNPYTTHSLILDNEYMEDGEKAALLNALRAGFGVEVPDSPAARILREHKELEDLAVNGADALIFPHDTLKSHVLGTRQRRRAYAVPHSFDRDLYPQNEPAAAVPSGPNEPVTFTFLGHSDATRSLDPLVRALYHLKCNRPELLDRIRVRCIGHVPSSTRDLIYNYHLHNTVRVESSVDYLESLAIMERSQWLVHIDAMFEELEGTGGSVFFAGKIADYLGTNAPILGITGHGSPAQVIIDHAGGVCVDPRNVTALAEALAGIVEGAVAPVADRAFRDRYASARAAERFDGILHDLVTGGPAFNRTEWPAAPQEEDKLISICIPSYNVECFLDRCLLSLLSCRHAGALDIIVVNDGSKDGTLEIARAWQEKFPQVVRIIDKQNGGHGSTINAALAQARGTYFRVIDGDDWVDARSFDEQIDAMHDKGIDADVISGNYYQVYFEDGHTVPWEKQGPSEYNCVYDFTSSDFAMEYFTMASSLFKTDVLRQANFQLQEHTFYVDVEYLLYPIPYTKTVAFMPEFVYRYAVGNADQSINPSTFTNRYDHHDRVIRRMLGYYKQHEPAMGAGQRAYMESLFARHLLQSHYLLSLVWDPDRERGLARARDFDEFLHRTDEALWHECGKRYAAVKRARSKGFDPNRIEKPENIDDGGRTFSWFLHRVVRRLKNTRVADALAANDSIRTAYRKAVGREE